MIEEILNIKFSIFLELAYNGQMVKILLKETLEAYLGVQTLV